MHLALTEEQLSVREAFAAETAYFAAAHSLHVHGGSGRRDPHLPRVHRAGRRLGRVSLRHDGGARR
jgi:hypothetical protein